MYYAHFGLREAPFKITPNTEFFFSGANRGPILEALIYAITQGEGIIKVTGEVGSGKTMLCNMLQATLPPTVETVYLANPSVGPDEILHAITFELHLLVAREAGRLEVMQTLSNFLLERHAQGKQVVVFVEESQSMPIATLEEIRLLSNLETGRQKLLQIVLFGQPELDENLQRPEIRQLRERISHSFALSPFKSGEIGDYLMFRMRAAGYKGPDLFSPRVVATIAKASYGLTRRINLLADKALLAAFSENTHTIKPKHVEAAIRDSEFSRERRSAGRPGLAAALSLVTVGIGLGAMLLAGYQAFLAPPFGGTMAERAPASGGAVRPSAPDRPQDVVSAPQQDLRDTGTPAGSAVAGSAAGRLQPATPPSVPNDPVKPPPDDRRIPTPSSASADSRVQLPAGPPDPQRKDPGNPLKARLDAASSPIPPSDTAPSTTSGTTVSGTSPPPTPTGQAGTPAQQTAVPAPNAARAGTDLFASRIAATEAWLKQGAASTVTIQLLGAENEPQLKEHLNIIAKFVETNQLFVYRTTAKDKPYLIVLYGSYANRKSAMDALDQLPAPVKAFRPYLRSLGGLRGDDTRVPPPSS